MVVLKSILSLLTISLSWLPCHALPTYPEPKQILARSNSVSRCSSDAFTLPPSLIPNATILSITASQLTNLTIPATPPFLNTDVPDLNICNVTIVLSHHGAGDAVVNSIWLPLTPDLWNTRFLGTGGSGWVAGLGAFALAPAVAAGYSAASTDAGLPFIPSEPGPWALKPDGTVNFELLENFASRSIHEMAVLGKFVTGQYYGVAKNAGGPGFHSYFNGCSTGGRQALAEAQMYPGDFEGIVAGAPAINWDRYVIAELWPLVAMSKAGVYPSNCELATFTDAAVATCDGDDGVVDGVITEPEECAFDPLTLVGKEIGCDGKKIVISEGVARVVREIWEGPENWYGLEKGAPLNSLANTTVDAAGKRVGLPFFVPDTWVRYFLKQDPTFSTASIGYAEYEALFNQSLQRYNGIIGTDNPDLSAFNEAGGKLLVWHGLSDQLIFPRGTVDYYQRVKQSITGREENGWSNWGHGDNNGLDNFFRLFLAPGVDHCGAGTTIGAIPLDPLSAVASWVENTTAPDALRAATLNGSFTRNVCKYPFVSVWSGTGDKNNSANWQCNLGVHA